MTDLTSITFTIRGRPPSKAGSGSPLGATSKHRNRACSSSRFRGPCCRWDSMMNGLQCESRRRPACWSAHGSEARPRRECRRALARWMQPPKSREPVGVSSHDVSGWPIHHLLGRTRARPARSNFFRKSSRWCSRRSLMISGGVGWGVQRKLVPAAGLHSSPRSATAPCQLERLGHKVSLKPPFGHPHPEACATTRLTRGSH